MDRRTALRTTAAAFTTGVLAGCSSIAGSSSSDTAPILQSVPVENRTATTKRIGVEVVQNHGNRFRSGYDPLGASENRDHTRKWPDTPGEYSVVLHVPTDEVYDLVTFSTTDPTTDEGQRWERDLEVSYSIEEDGKITNEIVEVSE